MRYKITLKSGKINNNIWGRTNHCNKLITATLNAVFGVQEVQAQIVHIHTKVFTYQEKL